jgi:hypothetical protein
VTEQELLVDSIRRLNRSGLAYCLTGSMASNYWGLPRTTHDIDFVVRLSAAEVRRLVDEFRGDFFLDETSVREAIEPPHQFNAIDSRSALKVDFWVEKRRPFDREVFQRRLQVSLFGEPTWIATPEDVVLHKLYWNTITPSERQVADAAGVVAVQGATLDAAYMRHWARELDVERMLEDLLSGRVRPKGT